MKAPIRIPLPPGAGPEFLQALGLSRTSVWRSMARGWYTIEYHNGSGEARAPQQVPVRYEHPDQEGMGMFALLTNPEGFVSTQVFRTFALFDPLGITGPHLGEGEDWIQEGLLKLWEERHTPGIRNPVAWMACRVRGMVKEKIKKGLRRARLTLQWEFEVQARAIEERLAGMRRLETSGVIDSAAAQAESQERFTMHCALVHREED